MLSLASILAQNPFPSTTFGGTLPSAASLPTGCLVWQAAATDKSDFNVRWILTAQCKNGRVDAQGKPIFVAASLFGYQSCLNSGLAIQNVDGKLQCTLPPGSWKNDCINARITAVGGETPGGNILVADCTLSGPPQKANPSQLQTLKFSLVDQCTTDIKVRQDPYNSSLLELWCGVPAGSYTQTCNAAVARDPWNVFNGASKLYAVCKNRGGNMQDSNPLPYPYLCIGFSPNSGIWAGIDIANNNGNLVCTPIPGGSPPPPQGCFGPGTPPCVQSGTGVPQGGQSQGCPGNPYSSCP